MKTLPQAPCPHCATPNCVSNIACHFCGRHLCDSNPFSPRSFDEHWTTTKPGGATDEVLEKHRRNFRTFKSWIGQEDRLLLVASLGVSVLICLALIACLLSPLVLWILASPFF